jgi:small subunit ribosomal protein S17
MADEPENNDTPETPESTGDQAAEAASTEGAEATAAATSIDAEAAAVEAPEPEPGPEPKPEPKTETETQDAPAAARVAAAPAEPAEQVSPKERRRKTRSTHSGEVRAARSPEERHAERSAERRAKAGRRRTRRLQERAKRADKRQGATGAPAEGLPPVHAPVEGRRSVRQGIVVSDKADKTITVRIDFARRHRRYEKIVRSSSTLHAHDEDNDAHEGDVVRVIESRPLSKSKRWKLVDVLERAR